MADTDPPARSVAFGGRAPGNPNSGHGHVYPRPDGQRARCGGPRMCSVCAADLARKQAEAEAAQPEKAQERQVLAGTLGGGAGFRVAVEGPWTRREAAIVVDHLRVAMAAMEEKRDA